MIVISGTSDKGCTSTRAVSGVAGSPTKDVSLGGNFFMDLGDGFNAEKCIVGDCGGDVGVMVCPLQSWQTTLGLYPTFAMPCGSKKM